MGWLRFVSALSASVPLTADSLPLLSYAFFSNSVG